MPEKTAGAAESAEARPKAFLSYSQTSSDYIARVVQLAEELTSHGVELVFDQWDLREGQDLHAFMEQAVTDPTVTHVLILCDPLYAEKADGRRAGVGTETLILSPGVYADVQQDRVVPVIMQRDENDQVQVPTYLKGRAYIDMSRPEAEADAYEQLLRVLYRRPARTRPPLGRAPDFLNEHDEPLSTAGAARVARTAIGSHRPDMVGRWADYLDRLADAIAGEEIRDVPPTDTQLGEEMLASIERLRPYRDEFIEILRHAARYAGSRLELFDRLHALFERLVTAQLRHQQRRFLDEAETENLGFATWELAVYTVAILLREQQFDALGRLLRPLHVESLHHGHALRSLGALEPSFPLQHMINGRSKTRRWVQPVAQRLRERSEGTGVSFEQMQEAELLLWLRATTSDPQGSWYGATLRTIDFFQGFPLFTRIRNPIEFTRAAPALGVVDRAAFVRSVKALDGDDFGSNAPDGGRSFFEQLLGLTDAERRTN